MIQLRRQWNERIFDPAFRDLSYREQGLELGVAPSTIGEWRKEINPKRWAEILEMTRQESAVHSLSVDAALHKKAMTGDPQAIKLWYERIEGWSPRQVNENINKNVELEGLSEEELLAKSLEGVPAEVLARILSKKGLGAPSVAPDEPKKAENGG